MKVFSTPRNTSARITTEYVESSQHHVLTPFTTFKVLGSNHQPQFGILMFYFIIGTRPEYIKLRPIWEKMPENSYKLVFTNQQILPETTNHPDALQLLAPPHNNLSDSFAGILQSVSILLSTRINPISGVIVQGDTTSAAAGALAAFQNHLPVYHVEA